MNMMTVVPKVQYKGTLAHGFSDIARHLGLSPSECLFINSLVVDQNHPLDKKIAATDDLDIRASQYVLTLSGQGSTAAHFELSPTHQAYVDRYLRDGTFLTIPKLGSGRLYPDGSVIAGIQKLFQGCGETACKQDLWQQHIQGKTIINSYCLSDSADLAAMAGTHLLNYPEAYLPFVCKSYVKENAERHGIPVAPGVTIKSPQYLQQNFIALQEQIRTLGLVPEQTKCWIKAGSLSGGQGIIPISGLTQENWDSAFLKIAQAYYDCGFFESISARPTEKDFNGCNYFMPVVADVDVGLLPTTSSVVMNTGVQAVISSDALTFVGTTLQQTKDGEYTGSILPDSSQAEAVEVAVEAAEKLLLGMQKDGYRGYAGVDVLITKSVENKLEGFVLEVNPRLTGGTPLLRMAQYAELMSGQTRSGNSANFYLPGDVDPVDYLYKSLGDEFMYQRDKSNFKGFIPAMIDQAPGRPTLVKGIIISDDASTALNLQKRAYSLLNSHPRM